MTATVQRLWNEEMPEFRPESKHVAPGNPDTQKVERLLLDGVNNQMIAEEAQGLRHSTLLERVVKRRHLLKSFSVLQKLAPAAFTSSQGS